MISFNIGALAGFRYRLFGWFNRRKDKRYIIEQALKTRKGRASLSKALLEAIKKVSIGRIYQEIN